MGYFSEIYDEFTKTGLSFKDLTIAVAVNTYFKDCDFVNYKLDYSNKFPKIVTRIIKGGITNEEFEELCSYISKILNDVDDVFDPKRCIDAICLEIKNYYQRNYNEIKNFLELCRTIPYKKFVKSLLSLGNQVE